MSKHTTEDTNRTETYVEEIAQSSRDDEAIKKLETQEDGKAEEKFNLDKPEKTEDNRDYEDIIREDEDPRAAIYKRHAEKRDTEIDESGEILVENADSTDIIEDQDDPQGKEELVEVKIYEQVRMVPKSKVDKAGGLDKYQKHLAVVEGMDRNAEQRKLLESREMALDERERLMQKNEAAIPAMDSQPPPNDPPPGDQTLEEKARQYQEAVYDGAEEAPSILADMVKTAANAGEKFDKDEFRKQVKDEVLLDQRQAKIVKASNTLIDLHPELNKRDVSFDPRLFAAVDDETNVVSREHPEWEPDEIVQESYNRVSKWKGGHKTETMTDKQEQKRATNRPRAGSQRYTPPPPAPRQTSSDYVKNLRSSRGQDV